MTNEKSYKKNLNVLQIIKDTISQNKVSFIILVIAAIVVVAVSLIPPQILKIIVDNYLTVGKGNQVLKVALIYLFFIILIDAFNLLQQIYLTKMGQTLSMNIRKSLFRKLHNLKSQYFTNNESGSIVSRFSNDVDSIELLFSEGIISMFIDVLKIIGILISLFMFSYKVSILVMILMPFIYYITRLFQKRMLKAQMENRKLVAKVSGHIPETINNMEMIKSFSIEKYMENQYKTYIEENYKTVEKVNFYDSIYSPIILIMRASVIALIAIACSKNFNIFGMTVGMVAASIEYISNIFSPIQSLGMELQSIQKSVSGIKRIDEFLSEEEKEKPVDKSIISKIIDDRKNITIKINNVSFEYDKGENIFNHLCIDILPLEKVTFMGRTGAGKSTLFKLILGLISPDSGIITINDVDTSLIPDSEKRKLFGYVEQNFHFIDGTIKDQISLKDSDITDEEVFNVMKFVGLHDYVCKFKDGYKTKYDKALFSKGQEQLLSVARAIVTNPPIMLLDEITANLDSKTEDNLINILNKAGEDRILLSISHRLSENLKDNRKILIGNDE